MELFCAMTYWHTLMPHAEWRIKVLGKNTKNNSLCLKSWDGLEGAPSGMCVEFDSLWHGKSYTNPHEVVLREKFQRYFNQPSSINIFIFCVDLNLVFFLQEFKRKEFDRNTNSVVDFCIFWDNLIRSLSRIQPLRSLHILFQHTRLLGYYSKIVGCPT